MRFNYYAIMALLFLISARPVMAIEYNNLKSFNTPETIVNIFDDAKIKENLKFLLNSHYEEYITNFQDVAEPQEIADGGLFVDGWLHELRLESSSALVIKPDGKIYAAWVKPQNAKVMYITNDKKMKGVHPDIIKWASRFKDVSFDDRPQEKPFKDIIPKISYFESRHYKAKVTINCTNQYEICNRAVYVGKKKSDGATVAVMGKVIRTNCNSSVCPAREYQFENKSTHAIYTLTTENPALKVSINGKVVINEAGEWINY